VGRPRAARGARRSGIGDRLRKLNGLERAQAAPPIGEPKENAAPRDRAALDDVLQRQRAGHAGARPTFMQKEDRT
jgi:hypothetical protein